MSDAQTSEQANNGKLPNPTRKLTKAQLRTRQLKAAATRAANKLAKANGGAQPGAPASVSTIVPTRARAAAMAARTGVGTSTDEIAAGFAARLKSAGPDWTQEYQQQFMAGLSAALPVICAPKAA